MVPKARVDRIDTPEKAEAVIELAAAGHDMYAARAGVVLFWMREDWVSPGTVVHVRDLRAIVEVTDVFDLVRASIDDDDRAVRLVMATFTEPSNMPPWHYGSLLSELWEMFDDYATALGLDLVEWFHYTRPQGTDPKPGRHLPRDIFDVNELAPSRWPEKENG